MEELVRVLLLFGTIAAFFLIKEMYQQIDRVERIEIRLEDERTKNGRDCESLKRTRENLWGCT